MHPGTGTKVEYGITLMTGTPGNTGKEVPVVWQGGGPARRLSGQRRLLLRLGTCHGWGARTACCPDLHMPAACAHLCIHTEINKCNKLKRKQKQCTLTFLTTGSFILTSSGQRLEHFWTCLLSRGLDMVCSTQLFSYTLADITLMVS